MTTGKIKLAIIIAAATMLFAEHASAHTTGYDLQSLTAAGTAIQYFWLGFTHILPLGFDHILFILGIFFLSPNLKSTVYQATAFTVAHSITLALAAAGVIHPLPYVIEPLIALSIAFIAVENMVIASLKWWRMLLIFGFGLVHGMGFAGVISEIGLPEQHFANAIISFNLGVETGQLAILLLANFALVRWIRNKHWYRHRFLIPASACIAGFAIWMTLERVG